MLKRAASAGIVCALALGAGTAEAGDPQQPLEQPRVSSGQFLEEPGWTLAELEQRVRELGIGRLGDEVRVSLVLEPAANPGLRRVRVQGELRGVPLGRPIASGLVDSAGRVRALVVTRPWSPASVGSGDAVASLDRRAALEHLESSGLDGASGAKTAELVWSGRQGTTRLVWRMDPPLDRAALSNPVFEVDAENGRILMVRERVRFAQVRAFEHNPVVSPAAMNFDLLQIDAGATELVGPRFAAKSAVSTGEAHTALADANGDFLYAEPDVTVPADNLQPDDPFAEVQMYFHADRFDAWLATHGFDGLECHQMGLPATLVANMREIGPGNEWQPFDNAFYSGDCDATMVFGQGSEVDFAYDGDVVAHEYGHGVVERLVPEGLWGVRLRSDARITDAGALNEAVADFLSAAFAGDAQMGEYVSSYWSLLGGDSLRDLDNTMRCPDDVVGEVHLDAVWMGGMMWEAYQAIGEPFVPVVLDTVSMLVDDATIEEFAAALRTTAGASLGAADTATIDSILEVRGLDECERVTPWVSGRRPIFVRQKRSAYTPYAPGPVQLRFDPPPDVDTLHLSFSPIRGVSSVVTAEGDVIPGVVVGRGAPVTFEFLGENPISVEPDTDEVVLDLVDSVDLPAVEGEPIFVAFVNTGDDRLRLDDIEAQWRTTGDGDGDGDGDAGSTSGTSDGDAGADDDTSGGVGAGGGGGAGCACAVQSTPVTPAGWALLALLLGAQRPRRRGAGIAVSLARSATSHPR